MLPSSHQTAEKSFCLSAPLKASSVPVTDGAIQNVYKFTESLLSRLTRMKIASELVSNFQSPIPGLASRKKTKTESSMPLNKRISSKFNQPPVRGWGCLYQRNWLSFMEGKFGSKVKARIKAAPSALLSQSTTTVRFRKPFKSNYHEESKCRPR